ncbi:hypothetical protein D3C72_1609610 [compost metagenome]
MPFSTSIRASPLDEPISAATELPVADSLALPLSSPMLARIRSTVGNSCLSFMRRAFMSTIAPIGSRLPSSRTVDTRLPPATPKLSGSSSSTPSCSLRWVTRSVIGSSASRMMRLPVKCTSASISSQRSVRNGATGSTLVAGCVTGLSLAGRPGLASAPISGARSTKRSWLDTRLPASSGRGSRLVKVSVPDRSLPPTRPVNFWYS